MIKGVHLVCSNVFQSLTLTVNACYSNRGQEALSEMPVLGVEKQQDKQSERQHAFSREQSASAQLI